MLSSRGFTGASCGSSSPSLFGCPISLQHDRRHDPRDHDLIRKTWLYPFPSPGEYMEVVNRVFASWDPDAVVMDRKTDTYADYTKVRPIHFRGKYFKCRGPLNTVPCPQGRPTYVQAGGSPTGRAFAAQHADSIIAVANGVAGMKAYRDDVRARAAAMGRNPDDIKVLYLVYVCLGETAEEARAKHARMIADARPFDLDHFGAHIRHQLGGVGRRRHLADFNDLEAR